MSTAFFGNQPKKATKSTAARQEAQTASSNVSNVKPTYTYTKPAGVSGTADTMERQIASRAAAPAADTSGGGGLGGGFIPSTAPVDMGPVDAFGNPIKTDEEYLKGDTVFQAQKNALQAALDAYLADTEAQKQTYSTNYGESLRKLGFTGDQGALDKAKWDPTENNGQGRWEDPEGNPFAGKINWNQTDTNTASGRGFENALNDFASRGTLQSSAYQRAYNNLQRQLNEQLASTASSKQTAMGEFDRAQAAKKSEKTTSEATASQEALARIKAAYGIG